MASDKAYLQFILDQLEGLEGLTYRAMMGEYLFYVQGKIVGGLFDDRLLVKNVPAARALLPDAPEEIPYPGAKPMLPRRTWTTARRSGRCFPRLKRRCPRRRSAGEKNSEKAGRRTGLFERTGAGRGVSAAEAEQRRRGEIALIF